MFTIVKTNCYKSLNLICVTCSSGDFLVKDEDTGEITRKKCNRVFHNGYGELVTLNHQAIDDEIENMKVKLKH